VQHVGSELLPGAPGFPEALEFVMARGGSWAMHLKGRSRACVIAAGEQSTAIAIPGRL